MNLAMLRKAAEYSPPRRGGEDAPSIKWIRSEIGAAGVVSSAKLFTPKHFAGLTTITASRYRARASRPSAASSVASRLLLMPKPSPPLRGGEYPHSTSSQFVHTFIDPRHSPLREFYSGNANTYMALLPLVVSSSGLRPTPR